MKSLMLFIFSIFILVPDETKAQIPDTLYTKAGTISADKKVVVTRTSEVDGKKIQEIQVMDSIVMSKEIAKIKQDTAQYRQYLGMLKSQETQIDKEKQRIRKILREGIRQLKLFETTLSSMKK